MIYVLRMLFLVDVICLVSIMFYRGCILKDLFLQGVNIGVVSSFLLAACITFIPNDRYYPPLPLQNNCSDDALSAANVTVVKDDIQLLLNTSDVSVTDFIAHDLPE